MKTAELVALEKLIKDRMGLPENYLRDRSRKRELSTARQMFFAIAYELRLGTYGEIGKYANRDHSTALYGHKNVLGISRFDKDLRDNMSVIMSKMPKAALTLKDQLHILISSLTDAETVKIMQFINIAINYDTSNKIAAHGHANT